MGLKEKGLSKDNVIFVLKDAKTGRVKQVMTHNIVTNAGDKYYAQRAAAETASLSMQEITVAASFAGTVGFAFATKTATYGDLNTIPSGGIKALDSGYPKTNDSDSDNTGADSDIVTWLTTYSTSEANTNIIAVCVHQTLASLGKAAAGTADNLVLNFATLSASLSKTNTDTLKVFVNHQFTGV